MCPPICERFSFPTRRRGQNGRILRHSQGMNGSAGLSPSRNRKPEDSTLSGYSPSLRKECAGLVAGQAVLTAELLYPIQSPTPSMSDMGILRQVADSFRLLDACLVLDSCRTSLEANDGLCSVYRALDDDRPGHQLHHW